MVDMHKRKLIDTCTHLCVHGILSSDTSPRLSLCPKDASNPYLTLLAEFPALTQVTTADTPVKHDVTHHIETTGPPVFAHPQRLAPDRLKAAKREFEHMLQLGIIAPPPAPGHPRPIWFQRRPPETGVRVVITVLSTGTQCQTDTTHS